MKLIDIAKSWYSFMKEDGTDLVLANERLAICDACPDKEQLSTVGKRLMNTINSESSTYKCGKCHCPLASKVFSSSGCPAGKW